MIVLELFAGTRSVSKAFEKRGHKTYSIEWNKDFENIDLYEDINNISVDDIKKLCGGGMSRRYMGKSRLYNIFSSIYIKT